MSDEATTVHVAKREVKSIAVDGITMSFGGKRITLTFDGGDSITLTTAQLAESVLRWRPGR